MHLKTARAALSCLVSLSLLPYSLARALDRRATICNGHAELCDRGYGNISFVGAHNSYAVAANNLAANQDHDITQQLNDGIRMLQSQAHLQNGEIHLCHTSCFLFDGGTLEDYLGKVKSWMDDNPDEVVTLLIVNSDNAPPTQFDTVFQSADLVDISYVPPTQPLAFTDWPTLGELIDSNKRLITFLSTSADSSQVPYLIDEFSNMWETAFDITDPALFDCSVNRTSGDPSTQLYTINHFLYKQVEVITFSIAPDKDALNTTNAASGDGSLGQHTEVCGGLHGRNPNFMLVDFYEYGGGSVFEVAATLNGVTYAPTSPIATPLPDTDETTVSSSAAITAFSVPPGVWTIIAGTIVGAWTIL